MGEKIVSVALGAELTNIQPLNGEKGIMLTTGYPGIGGGNNTVLQHAALLNLPHELRSRRQWVVAGPNKIPLAISGSYASVTDSNTWTDFDSAYNFAVEKGFHVGYVLSENDPYTCIDLDVKHETLPEVLEGYYDLISRFDSYTEQSISGKGFHIWVKGNIGAGRRREGVEIYSQERFIVCTGCMVQAKPIADRPEILNQLLTSIVSNKVSNVLELVDPDDDQDWYVVGIAEQDRGEFGRLFQGDWEGRHYPSQSEADLALIKMIARRTEADAACLSIFRMSGLGKRKKASRNDYALSTLGEARRQIANENIAEDHGRNVANAMLSPHRKDSDQYQLFYDGDIKDIPPMRWIVKHIIPDQGVGSIYGPSGSGKSFLALDLLAHIANGWQWFGNRVTAAACVYVPFEGKGGIPKRIAAWRTAMSQKLQQTVDSNIAFIFDAMNLRIRCDREKLIETITKAGLAGGVLVIDTLAQSAPGIEENSSQGMGEMISIFNELQNKLGGVVIIVHHTGKDSERGMRGWSGLPAALDFAIECKPAKEDKPRKFSLSKVKDDQAGKDFAFDMQSIHLGYDEDNDPITSLIVNQSSLSTFNEILVSAEDMAEQDDEFMWTWIRTEGVRGNFPSKNSLKSQLSSMKSSRGMTQARVRDSIERLLACNRIKISDKKSGNGNVWLEVIDTFSSANVAVQG